MDLDKLYIRGISFHTRTSGTLENVKMNDIELGLTEANLWHKRKPTGANWSPVILIFIFRSWSDRMQGSLATVYPNSLRV